MNYLGYVLHKTMLGATMALRVIEKIYSRLKFLYRKNRFFDVPLRRFLCNAFIQPHFDYACSAWYPNSTKKPKDKLQVIQNKRIIFCLKLQCKEHTSNGHFQKLDTNKSKVQTMCHLYNIHICSKQMPSLYG